MKSNFSTRHKRFMVPIVGVTLALLLVFIDANAPVPLYILWQRQMGFATSGISIIFICYNLGVLLSLLVAGRLSDIFGRRAVLVPALMLAIIASLCFAFAQSIAYLELGRLLVGFASGAFASAGTAAVMEAGAQRGYRFAPLVASFTTVMAFGAGPLLAGAFAQFAPLPTTLIFLLLIPCLIGVLFPILRIPPPTPAPPKTQSWLQLPRLPENNRSIILVAIMIFAGPFALSALFISLGPNLIAELLHNDSRLLAGACAFVVFGAGAIAQLTLRRWQLTTILFTSQLLSLSGAILVVAAEINASISLLLAAALSAGFGQSLSQFAGITLVKQYAPPKALAGVTGTFFFGGYITAGISVAAMGFAANAWGLQAGSEVFVVLCGLVILAALAGALVVLRRPLPSSSH
jgi:MFS family permease